MATSAGQRFVRRQNASRGSTANSTAADITYDTAVLSEGGYSYASPEATVDTAGKYLTIFDIGQADLASSRAVGTLVPYVNNAAVAGNAYRATHRYLRSSGGAQQGASIGFAVLDLAANDDVKVRNPGVLTPTDAAGNYATNASYGGALQMIYLGDPSMTEVRRTTDAAEVGTSNINTTRPWLDSSGTWTTITYNSEVVDDDGLYPGTGGDITLAASTKYLIVWGTTIYSSDSSRHTNVTRLQIGGTNVQTASGFHRNTGTQGPPMGGIYLHETGGSSETLRLQATHETEGGDAGTPNVSDAYVQVITLPSSAEWIHVDNGATDSLTTALAGTTTWYDTPLSSTVRSDGGSNLSLDSGNDAVQNDSGGTLPVLAIGWHRFDRDSGSSGTRKNPWTRWDNGGSAVGYGVAGSYSRGQQSSDDNFQAHHVSAATMDLATSADLSFQVNDEASGSNSDMGIYASTSRYFLGVQVLDLNSLEATGPQDISPAVASVTVTAPSPVVSLFDQELSPAAATVTVTAPSPTVTQPGQFPPYVIQWASASTHHTNGPNGPVQDPAFTLDETPTNGNYLLIAYVGGANWNAGSTAPSGFTESVDDQGTDPPYYGQWIGYKTSNGSDAGPHTLNLNSVADGGVGWIMELDARYFSTDDIDSTIEWFQMFDGQSYSNPGPTSWDVSVNPGSRTFANTDDALLIHLVSARRDAGVSEADNDLTFGRTGGDWDTGGDVLDEAQGDGNSGDGGDYNTGLYIGTFGGSTTFDPGTYTWDKTYDGTTYSAYGKGHGPLLRIPIVGQVIEPAAATITASAPSPTVENATSTQDVSPAAATVTASGPSPTLTTTVDVTPAVATVTISSPSPTITTGAVDIAPAAATVTTTAYSPTLTVGAVDISPAAATVTVTAYSPTVTTTIDIAPATATISATSPSPTISSTVDVAPALATVTVTAPAPTLTTGAVDIAPSLATITVSAPSPVVGTGAISTTPAAASVTVTAPSPTITSTVNISPPVAKVGGAATVPSIGATGWSGSLSGAVTSRSVTLPSDATAPESGDVIALWFTIPDRTESPGLPTGSRTFTLLNNDQYGVGEKVSASVWLLESDGTEGGDTITVTHSFERAQLAYAIIKNVDTSKGTVGAAAFDSITSSGAAAAHAARTPGESTATLLTYGVHIGAGDAEPMNTSNTTDWTKEWERATNIQSDHSAQTVFSAESSDGSQVSGGTLTPQARTDRSWLGFGVEFYGTAGGITVFDPSIGVGLSPVPPTITVSTFDPTITTGAVDIAPAAATVTASAPSPTVSVGAFFISPTAASVTATAYDPTVTTSVDIAPATATVTVSGPSPTVAPQAVDIAPGTASVTVGASDPTVSVGAVSIAPDAATVTVTAPSPTVGLEIEVLHASITVTAFDPVLIQEQFVTPAIAQVTATGYDPTVTSTIDVAPAAATVTVSAFDPTLTTSVDIAPATATVLVTAQDPVLTTTVEVSPAIAQVTVSTFDPVVIQEQFVTPDVATVTVSTPLLTITQDGGTQFLAPEVSTVTVSGLDPTISTGAVDIAPGTASVTVTPQDPTITSSVDLGPSSATVSVTAFSPTVSIESFVTPDPASVSVTAQDPVLTTTVDVTPALAQVTVSGPTPVVSTSGVFVTPAAATITASAFDPTLTTTVDVSPALATVTVGASDPVLTTGAVDLSPDLAQVTVATFDPSFTISVPFSGSESSGRAGTIAGSRGSGSSPGSRGLGDGPGSRGSGDGPEASGSAASIVESR